MCGNELKENYRKLMDLIKRLSAEVKRSPPELLVVSKYQSLESIRRLHEEEGQQSFGENYVQELLEKSNTLPRTIKWHFIGHLQSNKVKSLLSIDNLEIVETVDSKKLAGSLDQACRILGRENLNIMIQVKTSDEATKSGAEPSEIIEIFDFVISECKNLRFKGLMTMGNSNAVLNHKCFDKMLELRKLILQRAQSRFSNLSIECRLSMGTSRDLQLAIENYADEVRVGSAIFGERVKTANR
ncbi:pyridoxal phosphate homeostasis protein-like [Cryptosporidium felis]|nr:pyridoxal phosphate homeostasis protein-like [Cryptosporidium felis]